MPHQFWNTAEVHMKVLSAQSSGAAPPKALDSWLASIFCREMHSNHIDVRRFPIPRFNRSPAPTTNSVDYLYAYPEKIGLQQRFLFQ